MNERRKIVIASPCEPCGATWLINCFLELGILTYRHSEQTMWQQKGNSYCLKPQENILKKWLPSLYFRKQFNFKQDIEVEWVHEWPTSRFSNNKIIFFYRDPRDALYSRYKREAPNMGFAEYLEFIDYNTLLDKIESNYLFTCFWKEHSLFRLFRFEDYKKDPEQTLRIILDYIGVSASDEEISLALHMSTSDRAMEAEKLFRLELPQEKLQGSACQVVNQGGLVGRWQELEGNDRNIAIRIEQVNGTLLREFGYSVDHPVMQIDMDSYVSHLKELELFKDIICCPAVSGHGSDYTKAALNNRTIKFASNLTNTVLIDSGNSWCNTSLLYNLSCYVYKRDWSAFHNIRNVAEAYISRPDFYFNIYKKTKDIRALAHIGLPMISKKAISVLKRRLCG